MKTMGNYSTSMSFRLLRVPWIARKSNQSVLKEINPEYSLEGLMLMMKLQYSGHLMWRANSLEKTLMLGKIKGRRRRGWQRTVWWHHWLNGHESEQAPGHGVGQWSPECCSTWGCRVVNDWVIEQQNIYISSACVYICMAQCLVYRTEYIYIYIYTQKHIHTDTHTQTHTHTFVVSSYSRN